MSTWLLPPSPCSLQEGEELGPIGTLTVRQFMATLDGQIDQNLPIFPKACTPTLSPPQLKFLEALPTVMVFTCLQLFIQWLKDGMYDFHTLPFTLKSHLSPNDLDALRLVPTKWKGGTLGVCVCPLHLLVSCASLVSR